MTDYVTPSYAAKSAQGRIINSPMTSVKSEYALDSIQGWMFRNNSNCTRSEAPTCPRWLLAGQLSPVSHLPMTSVDLDTLKTLSGTEAAAGVTQPEFETQVFAAELRETLRFLRNPLATLGRAANNFARGRRVNPATTSAEAYLSYRYGLRPLMADARAVVSAVQSLGSARLATRRTSRGYREIVRIATSTDSFNEDYRYTRAVTTTTKVGVRAGILYDYTGTDAFNQLMGLRMSDILPAVYEGATLSFVLDWFVNLGDLIRAIQPHLGVRILSSWTSVKTVQETVGNVTSVHLQPGFTSTLNPSGTERLTTTTVDRSVGHSVGLAVEPTPFTRGLDLNLGRVFDALALIHVNLGGNHPSYVERRTIPPVRFRRGPLISQ